MLYVYIPNINPVGFEMENNRAYFVCLSFEYLPKTPFFVYLNYLIIEEN